MEMTHLTIKKDSIKQIIDQAKEIMSTTPVSFWESDEINLLFGENSSQFFKDLPVKEKEELHLKLDHMDCLPIGESEFFNCISPELVTCPNPKCMKFK